MKLIGTSSVFPEVKYYESKIFQDHRGKFSKPFFGELLTDEFNNSYEVIVSKSNKNVIRGLHFQLPPQDVSKIVFCLEGSIKDVFVDLRLGSSNYGKSDFKYLDSQSPISIFIPKGFAHGFSVLSKSATVLYLQSGPFSDEHDSGILYSSADIDWEIKKPVLSEKDNNLIDIKNFHSPWK